MPKNIFPYLKFSKYDRFQNNMSLVKVFVNVNMDFLQCFFSHRIRRALYMNIKSRICDVRVPDIIQVKVAPFGVIDEAAVWCV